MEWSEQCSVNISVCRYTLLEWSKHGARHTKLYFILSYPNLHFPPIFIKIGPKLPKFAIGGVIGVVGRVVGVV